MGKISTKAGRVAKTYTFKAIVEPDEDRWFACCPTLEKYAAATWGYTREEALKNIKEVLLMTIESMIEDGQPIPEDPLVQIPSELVIAVTV